MPKELVTRYGYNEYMVHHYVYITKVVEEREPDSYIEAAKDMNWRATMEEEMRTIVGDSDYEEKRGLMRVNGGVQGCTRMRLYVHCKYSRTSKY